MQICSQIRTSQQKPIAQKKPTSKKANNSSINIKRQQDTHGRTTPSTLSNGSPNKKHNDGCYYNFGNNARKSLKTFLYYKHPDNAPYKNKLKPFFGDNGKVSSLIVLMSELSHGAFERSSSPVDVLEIKETAQCILDGIKDHDHDQPWSQWIGCLRAVGRNWYGFRRVLSLSEFKRVTAPDLLVDGHFSRHEYDE